MALTLKKASAAKNQIILDFSEEIAIAGGGVINPSFITILENDLPRAILSSELTGSRLMINLSGSSPHKTSIFKIYYNPQTINANQGFIIDSKNVPLTATSTVAIYKRGNLVESSSDSLKISLKGDNLNNIILGNIADNIINGLGGSDTMSGGIGNDIYIVDNIGDVVMEQAGQGVDTVQSYVSYTLGNHLENLSLLGKGKINGNGNANNNIITGNQAANTLGGGGGSDTLIGGRGDDVYIVDSSDDVIVESGLQDIDLVKSSVSWALGNLLENLTLTGNQAINGTGNEMNNVIIGNDSSNTLDGGTGGVDRLTGLSGSDIFLFSSQPYRFGKSYSDHITDFSPAEGDKIHIIKAAFGITSFSSTLVVVSNALALNTALTGSSIFVYSSHDGALHWNENSIAKGAGAGGIIAILDNKPVLGFADIVLV